MSRTRPALRLGSVRRRGLALLVLCLLLGLAAGWLWYALWTPPQGVVAQKQWWLLTPSEVLFDGTGWYVVLALAGGMLTGWIASRLMAGREFVGLGWLLLGAGVAGFTMYALGHALGPADPHALAATAPEMTRLPGALEVATYQDRTGVWWSPALLSWPIGALLTASVMLLTTSGPRSEVTEPLISQEPLIS